MFGSVGTAIFIAVIVVVVLFVISISIMGMWKKVPQDKALVITGLKKRVVSGGGGFVIPLLERSDAISLENMQVVVNIKGLTSTGVDIEVGALTVLKVKNLKENILAAMEQFNTGRLDSTTKNIMGTSKEVLEGKLREILSGMTVEEIYQNREKFASSVQEVAAKELEDMGLEIKAFTIKDIRDDNGYLDSLGKKQVAEVKKNALIAESNARKEQELTIADNEKQTSIKKAELARETAVMLSKTRQEEEQARLAAEIEINESNKLKELKVLSNFEEVQKKKASTDAAYGIQNNKIQKEVIETGMEAKLVQESKNVELIQAQMKVELTRKEQETTIAKQEALRKQEVLVSEIQKTAEAQASKIKTEADADLYKKQKDAEAEKSQAIRKAEADAESKKLQAESEATFKRLQAAAEAESLEKKGLAEAVSVEAVGKAEASSIREKGLAEAEVIRAKALAEAEAMTKKAEAYEKYGQAAMTEMVVQVLPEITRSLSEAVAGPMSKIGNITIVDSGHGDGSGGASKVSGYAANILTQVPEVVKATTGIDLINMISKLANDGLGKTPDDN